MTVDDDCEGEGDGPDHAGIVSFDAGRGIGRTHKVSISEGASTY